MKLSQTSKPSQVRAFTLVELLVVIAIIAILAAMLLPVVNKAIGNARVKKARVEIAQLAQAIQSYHSQYTRYPLPPLTQAEMTALLGAKSDFTFGGRYRNTNDASVTLQTGQHLYTNDPVIAVLLNLTNYPSGEFTINRDNIKNVQQIKFLNATMVSEIDLAGVGPDLVYRDPWGNPYFITVDMNGDDRCLDAFYGLRSVSQERNGSPIGFNGLRNSRDTSGNSDFYEYSGGVMVWSLGPDKKADIRDRANAGANKDNVVSWRD